MSRVVAVRLLGGRISGRVRVRGVLGVLVLLGVALAVGVASLPSPDAGVSLGETVDVLAGRGTRITELVVLEWRLPRVLTALLFGAMMGLSGAIFQVVTRNALGSPDVIGFSSGAYTGVLVALLVLDLSGPAVPVAATLSGLLTAGVVLGLAGHEGLRGARFIILGIAAGALLSSVNTWLVLRATAEEGLQASQWGVGTLNGITWADLRLTAGCALVLLPAVMAVARPLALHELGDDVATALGLRLRSRRLLAVGAGVALTAVTAAVAGPIAFVALAAPQLARRVVGGSPPALVASAAMGAVLLAASDLVAQRVFAPTALPVGMVTVVLGGCYLAWLLYRRG
ncbi:iron chelate uptake ABC transporter family permease subunit [Nocardioides sp. LHD-245]|uniref:FecCD family ABC transporter permease n=1 Tax=Nocardioides sp. LHD-245 TaxID=3051387 RepID=UPI0027DF7FC0|nr:iron chelate uptake ABC transporter family permease subunit [Nocardioides sp. LHD-245]